MVDLELLLTHEHFVRGVARALLRDDADVDDVVQETYRIALSRSPQPSPSFSGWLATVARRVALGLLRTRARRDRLQKDVTPGKPPPSPHEVIEREELRQRVVAAVLGLDEPYRGTVLLVYLEGLTPEEAATRQRVSIDTIRTRLKRARARLREQLERGEDRTHVIAGLAVLAGVGTGASAATAGGIVGAIAMGNALKAAAVVGVLAFGAWFGLDALRVDPAESTIASAPADPTRDAIDASGADDPLAAAHEPTVVARDAIAAGADVTKGALTTTIRGRVVNGDGRPLAGITVARAASIGRAQLARRFDERRVGPGAEPCTTAADGSFAWSTRTLVERDPLTRPREDNVVLEFSGSGFAGMRETVLVLAGSDTDIGTRTLSAACVIVGHVRGPDGAPVEGALVTAVAPERHDSSAGELLMWGPYGGDETKSTDANGEYRLDQVPAGPTEVWAVARGTRCGSTAAFECVAGAERYGVDVTIEPRATEDTIEGVILLADGSPAPAAEIALTSRLGTLEFSTFVRTTSADGRFTAVVPAPGPWDIDVVVRKPSYELGVVYGIAGGARDVSIHTRSEPTFTLRVVARDGAPVEMFDVDIRTTGRVSGYSLQDARPDADGLKRLEGSIEPFWVEVFGPEFKRAAVGPLDPDALPALVEVTLDRIEWLRGRVVDASGAPVANAFIYELRTPEPTRLPILQGLPSRFDRTSFGSRTDATGAFRFDAERADWNALHIEPGGQVPMFAAADIARDAFALDGVATIVLTPGGAIEGRVVDALGVPQPGAIVVASHGDGFPLTTRCAPDGSFRFEHRAAGAWLVRPWHEEISWGMRRATAIARAADAPFALPANCEVTEGHTTSITLRLDDFAPRRVTGTLSLEGAPLRPAEVELALETGGTASAAVTNDGAFDVAALSVGAGALRITCSEFDRFGVLELFVPVVVGDGPTTTAHRALQGGRVSGRVIGDRPRWANDITFEGQSGDARVRAVVPLNPDGSFEFAWIPVGYGTLSVGETKQSIEVTSAGSVSIEVNVR